MTLGPRRTQRQLAGDAGEEAALAHLQGHGLVLVERNFHCRGGELDLIMRDGATLVFVEVRRRAGRAFGGAAASIGSAKQARLWNAAQTYLQRYRMPPPCRFDVVAIEGAALDWLKNAIQA
ncbi:YraN family protein [Noviherbaspirillum sp. 1P10PC]|uniref:YraN family protein n=1 Tax=Noviherbaspirillum sp. 1P10PC TaxID=3132292 RepID=UPI0039A0F759